MANATKLALHKRYLLQRLLPGLSKLDRFKPGPLCQMCSRGSADCFFNGHSGSSVIVEQDDLKVDYRKIGSKKKNGPYQSQLDLSA